MRAGSRIRVEGMVQGLGYRPFLYRTAVELGLDGFVKNTGSGIFVEVYGEPELIEILIERVKRGSPSISSIRSIVAEPVDSSESREVRGFRIIESSFDRSETGAVTPDMAICERCRSELFDKGNRRYLYPFISCTSCGPRFTVIESLPYDRARTTMRGFAQDEECLREFNDPLDRRFHSQINACDACGPRLSLFTSGGRKIAAGGDAIRLAVLALAGGSIVALKGVGGFHLACDASMDRAVVRLRIRKGRYEKPLAVMTGSIDEAAKLAFISAAGMAEMESWRRPILIAPMRRDVPISRWVAPRLGEIGIMIPYTPMHEILFSYPECPRVLVMTSGNISDRPIMTDYKTEGDELRRIADYVLDHDRPIARRCDDSVVKDAGRFTVLVRRSRGYAPEEIRLPFEVRNTLACGGELKNVFALSKDRFAFLSQHIGDVTDAENFEAYRSAVRDMKRLLNIEPEVVAYDLHPDYLTSAYGRDYGIDDSLEDGLVGKADGRFDGQSEDGSEYRSEYRSNDRGLRKIPVQHHVAHIASCMAENGVTDGVVGIAFDGAGYGADGMIWGGEVLVGGLKGFRRVGHLRYVPQPSGDIAVKEPWRMAVAYMHIYCRDERWRSLPMLKTVERQKIEALREALVRGLFKIHTSSIGRLFDAVAAMIGTRGKQSYEGQAAMELESLAAGAIRAEASKKSRVRHGERLLKWGSYSFSIDDRGDGTWAIDPLGMINEIISDVLKGEESSRISLRFHATIARMIAESAARCGRDFGYGKVALSGGVFQNAVLLKFCETLLASMGFEILLHSKVPCNDGGIALGQTAVANMMAEDAEAGLVRRQMPCNAR